MLDQITPVVLTRDEEPNIARTLAQLTWAREVIVVDSFSTDATVQIARSFDNVTLLQRSFDSLAGQSTYGISRVGTDWVMLLDADYFVPRALTDELRALNPPPDAAAFRATFTYAMGGRPLLASLYPPRILLLRRNRTRVWQDGHAHRVEADGRVLDLRAHVIHDDRKSFARFMIRQRAYMRQEADKLQTVPWRRLNAAGRLRKLIFVAPAAVLVHTLLVKWLLLDGRAGFHYAAERFVAELILSRELLRRALAARKPPRPLTPAAPSDPPSPGDPSSS